MSRIIAPIAYNFLLLIRDEDTAFYKVMGYMNLTPLLGEEYNVYFPIVLVLFCVANYFDLYSRFIQNCCAPKFHKFVFDEKFNDSKIDQGRDIIRQERDMKERGLNSTRYTVRSRFFLTFFKMSLIVFSNNHK